MAELAQIRQLDTSAQPDQARFDLLEGEQAKSPARLDQAPSFQDDAIHHLEPIERAPYLGAPNAQSRPQAPLVEGKVQGANRYLWINHKQKVN